MTTPRKDSIIASRYATALIDLAEEHKKLKHVEKDLADLTTLITENKDLAALVNSPMAGAGKQATILADVADKAGFQKLTKNFLGVLAQNRRLNVLEGVIDAFDHCMAERRGEVSVVVKVAQDLSATQRKALEKSLAESLKTEVALNVEIDPSILGGMIVTVGSHMIDDSIARKLSRLKVAMNNPANQDNPSKPSDVKEA